MSSTRKLKISFLDPNYKAGTLTVSNMNTSSDTSNATLLNFATGLINLTNNTYVSTTKNDEEKID